MFLKKVIDSILYSSLFIATCAFGLVWLTYLLIGEEVSFRLAGLLFFSTLFLYNLGSLLPGSGGEPFHFTEQRKWLMTHLALMRWITLLAGALAGYLFLTSTPALPFWFLLHLLVISLLYSMPGLSRKFALLPLRQVPLLKAFVIAYVWSALTVLLPLLYLGLDLLLPAHIWLFVRRFLYVFALAVLFDIRDFTRDQATGIFTFPVMMGTRYTKTLCLTVMLLFLFLTPLHTDTADMLALAGSGIVSVAVIILADEDRPESYYLGLVDGMMLLQFLLALVLKEA